jgi:hypothetical protein
MDVFYLYELKYIPDTSKNIAILTLEFIQINEFDMSEIRYVNLSGKGSIIYLYKKITTCKCYLKSCEICYYIEIMFNQLISRYIFLKDIGRINFYILKFSSQDENNMILKQFCENKFVDLFHKDNFNNYLIQSKNDLIVYEEKIKDYKISFEITNYPLVTYSKTIIYPLNTILPFIYKYIQGPVIGINCDILKISSHFAFSFNLNKYKILKLTFYQIILEDILYYDCRICNILITFSKNKIINSSSHLLDNLKKAFELSNIKYLNFSLINNEDIFIFNIDNLYNQFGNNKCRILCNTFNLFQKLLIQVFDAIPNKQSILNVKWFDCSYNDRFKLDQINNYIKINT